MPPFEGHDGFVRRLLLVVEALQVRFELALRSGLFVWQRVEGEARDAFPRVLHGTSVPQRQLVVQIGVAVMVGAAVLARPIAPSHVAREKYGGCFGASKTFEKETVHFYHETDLLQGVHVFFLSRTCVG